MPIPPKLADLFNHISYVKICPPIEFNNGSLAVQKKLFMRRFRLVRRAGERKDA